MDQTNNNESYLDKKEGKPLSPYQSSSSKSASSNKLKWELWGLKEPAQQQLWSHQECPHCSKYAENLIEFKQTRPQQTKLQQINPQQTVVTQSKGIFHCERCGFHGDARIDPHYFKHNTPIEFNYPWWKWGQHNGETQKWFANQGIEEGIIGGLEIGLTKSFFAETNSWEASWIFPCRQNPSDPWVDVIALQLTPHSYGNQRRQPQGNHLPWGWDSRDTNQTIIVDHPMDRLALLQAGLKGVVCVDHDLDPRQTKQEWNFLLAIEKDVSEIKKFVLALRDDEHGHELEGELARRLGKEKCWRVRWKHHRTEKVTSPETYSAIDYLKEFGKERVKTQINEASPFPITGVHELNDVEEKFDLLYEFGLEPGASTGWPTLDQFYTVKPGQWTAITGIPGHGKSNWLDSLMINLAKQQDWRFGIFSPENQPLERHFASLMEKAVDMPFNEGYSPRIPETIKEQNKPWINDHFKIILPDEDNGNWSVDGVLELAKTLVYRYGIKGAVIDPWNELDHTRPAGMTETDHISASLTKIRRFARKYDVHVWLVAHPAKIVKSADGKYPVPTMYDISGCHDDQTEALTEHGWKLHSALTYQDKVAVIDRERRFLRFEHPIKILSFPWNSSRDGKMVCLKNDKLDAKLTPNHRILLKHPHREEWGFLKAEAVAERLQQQEIIWLPWLEGMNQNNWVHHNGSQNNQNQGGETELLNCPYQYRQLVGESLNPEIFQETTHVKKAVIDFWWPATKLSLIVTKSLASDLYILAQEQGQRVVINPIINHSRTEERVELKREIEPLPIDQQTLSYESYMGMVYCLKVATGAYLTRRNGKVGLYGNSAHWRNKADNGICVYRNVGGEDDDIAGIHIQKIRFREVGKVGLVFLRGNRKTGNYYDDLNQLECGRALQNGKVVPSHELLVAPRQTKGNTESHDSSRLGLHPGEDRDDFFDRILGEK